MRKIVYRNGNYSIYQVGKERLREVAEFVVRENYKHHTGTYDENMVEDEIMSVYKEELAFVDNSLIFVVYDSKDRIIGSIRVFKWNRNKPLPIEKLFGINPLVKIHSEGKYNFWHIGRFAINKELTISTVSLFKQLMLFAVHPIVSDRRSYMIAETDSKLLRVMNALGIKTKTLGKSIYYLASETIPVCSSKRGLLPFYKHYNSLLVAS